MKESLIGSWNRLLTNNDRKEYEQVIMEMFKILPDMMARKIPTANVQQAFTVDAVKNFSTKKSKILCAGHFEDTAYEFLLTEGYRITGIDPVINHTLHHYSNVCGITFDTIFSCSVIEHVGNDEEFLTDIVRLLKSNGVGILTCDFRKNYQNGDRLPYTSKRFYTPFDLKIRFKLLLEKLGCYYVDEPEWDSQPYDFNWEGIAYDFATMVFKKG